MTDKREDDGDILTIDPMTKVEPKVQKPSLWACKFYNDDFTPMEFVVGVLVQVFKLGVPESMAIMMAVHKGGSALVGKYPKDVAETKALEVMNMAKAEQHPLKVDAVPA